MGTHIDLDLVALLKYTLSTTHDQKVAMGCWRQLRKLYRGPLYLIALPAHRTAESRDLVRHMIEAHRDEGASCLRISNLLRIDRGTVTRVCKRWHGMSEEQRQARRDEREALQRSGTLEQARRQHEDNKAYLEAMRHHAAG